jgi:cyclic pyranopterin phosphate synthase
MIDVGDKDVTRRVAVASGSIYMDSDTLGLVSDASGPKGNVLTTAELAGVMGAKRTSDFIPMCHPLMLDHVRVEATVDERAGCVTVRSSVRVTGRTGVEMEALSATAIALLTVYDMVKSAGHGMEIGGIRLLEKRGGSGGDWEADHEPQT